MGLTRVDYLGLKFCWKNTKREAGEKILRVCKMENRAMDQEHMLGEEGRERMKKGKI